MKSRRATCSFSLDRYCQLYRGENYILLNQRQLGNVVHPFKQLETYGKVLQLRYGSIEFFWLEFSYFSLENTPNKYSLSSLDILFDADFSVSYSCFFYHIYSKEVIMNLVYGNGHYCFYDKNLPIYCFAYISCLPLQLIVHSMIIGQ